MPTRTRYCPHCTLPTDAEHCPADGVGTIVIDGIDVLASASLHPGELFAKRYRIVQRIGKGGFGAVYEAEHTGSGQLMALKVLALDPADGGRDVFFRFFREARITASLRHANTVRLHDFGQAETGALFMAMELLRGPTLEKHIGDLVAQGRTMTGPQACTVGIAVLKSLAEAHAVQLVHRDLKPDNIVLSDQGEEEAVVKVLDFGIARAGESRLTGNNRVLGTPAYMSPEQCKGNATLDGRSDLYALGVILFRAVCGRLPFTGDMYALLSAHQNDPVPDLAELAQTPVIAPFVAIVHRALAKRPEDRFADARSMRLALEAALASDWQTTTPVAPAEVADTEDVLIITTGMPIDGAAVSPKQPVVVRRGPSGQVTPAKAPDTATPAPDLPAPLAVVTPAPVVAVAAAGGKRRMVLQIAGGALAALGVVWWLSPKVVAPAGPVVPVVAAAPAAIQPDADAAPVAVVVPVAVTAATGVETAPPVEPTPVVVDVPQPEPVAVPVPVVGPKKGKAAPAKGARMPKIDVIQ